MKNKIRGVNYMNDIQRVLSDLKPFVIVVGSYARGEQHSLSDIDLYIKRKTQQELDEEFYDIEEHYIKEVISVFESHNLKWDSLVIGYIHTNSLSIQIEASNYFKIHRDTPIKKINVLGVEMDSAVDNKFLKYDETI